MLDLYSSIKAHNKVCVGFHITGVISRGIVYGVCSTCREVIERPVSKSVIKDETPARVADWQEKWGVSKTEIRARLRDEMDNRDR